MKKFVIITNPQAGSEYINEILNSHPDIICHPELFSKKEWNMSEFKISNMPFEYLSIIYNSINIKIWGYTQLSFLINNMGFRNCREFIKSSFENNFVFIFLERTDLLKSYVSYLLMHDRNLHLTNKTIKLNPDEAFVNVRNWSGFNIYTKEILKDYKTEFIVINYEEDFSDIITLHNRLYEFLGVKDIPITINKSLKEIDSFNIEEKVINYSEVIEYFKLRKSSLRKVKL